MTLIDRFNPDSTLGLHSACWGYVAPDGREYALLGIQSGTSIVDITESPLREVAFIWGPRSNWREMKVYGVYAYIVTESRDSGNGLQIVDLSDLPRSARLIRTDSSLFKTAHTVNVADHFLYAMGTQAEAAANGGAIIMDLEPDPLHPRRVGAVSPYYYHDAFVRNDTLVGAAINGQGCDIYHIGDPQNPRHIATITYPYSGTHNAELTQDGRYVITTDEVNFTPKTLKVWDIRDPEHIRKVADYTPTPGDIVHNVRVRGRYAIVAWYTAGVRIIDIIDPHHPREVAYYDTHDGPRSGFEGVWEVYGPFPSGKIIAFDRITGLYVLTFNGAVAGSLSGVVRNRSTGDPLPGVSLSVAGRADPVVTDVLGRYYVGGVRGESLGMSIRHFGYAWWDSTLTIGSDLTFDVELDPLPLYRATIRVQSESGDSLPEFGYAVEGLVPASGSTNGSATLLLPRDSAYMVTVGAWGFRTTTVPVAIHTNGEVITLIVPHGYYDNATLDLGWSYEAVDDSAPTGRWVRIVPYLGYLGSGWIHPAREPSGNPFGSIFVTGAPPRNAPPQLGDVNYGSTTLTTPIMDLTTHVDPSITFDLWFVQYRHDSLDVDSMRIDLSNDGGSTWASVHVAGDGRDGWKRFTFRPASILPLTHEMLVRFIASDVRGLSLINCAIDNFEVSGGPTSVSRQRSDEPQIVVTPVTNPSTSEHEVLISTRRDHRTVSVDLFDSRGGLVQRLHEGALSAGNRRIALGPPLHSGIYFLRVRTGEGIEVVATLSVTR